MSNSNKSISYVRSTTDKQNRNPIIQIESVKTATDSTTKDQDQDHKQKNLSDYFETRVVKIENNYENELQNDDLKNKELIDGDLADYF